LEPEKSHCHEKDGKSLNAWVANQFECPEPAVNIQIWLAGAKA
jgi:hypothetical protein